MANIDDPIVITLDEHEIRKALIDFAEIQVGGTRDLASVVVKDSAGNEVDLTGFTAIATDT